MTAVNLLASNISSASNFYQLALFICQLFLDGKFQTVQFMYDPKVFDDRLIAEVEVNCDHVVPWQTIDITQPSSLHWNQNDRTDYILQLIFFDPEHLIKEIQQFRGYLTFYRIFVLPSFDAMEPKEQHSTMRTYYLDLSSSTLILYYDAADDHSISVDWTPISTYGNRNSRPMCLKPDLFVARNENIDRMNLFDQTFGKYEQTIAINVQIRWGLRSPIDHKYLANYYHLHLNPSYLNSSEEYSVNRLFKPKPQKLYKEMTPAYELIDYDIWYDFLKYQIYLIIKVN